MSDNQLTLGSLFDGIGGFPLAASRCGIKPMWASEIDGKCCEVTKHHFPDMAHLGDITKLDGSKLPPVDIISGGSPCQDLSIAGKQAGLKGGRSGLFLEMMRIVGEMRNANESKYPRYVFWENVPGALNSNKGEDFRQVVSRFVESDVPMPGSEKWSKSGVVRCREGSFAWRILDAQYFGVPQRRRRIFAIRDFGGDSAGKILFERESVRRNPSKGGEAGKGVTDAITGSPYADRWDGGQNKLIICKSIDCRNLVLNDEISGTLQAKESGSYSLNYTNPVMISRREDGDRLIPCYWDGGQLADTLDASISAKQQTMPEKRRFNAVIQEPCVAFSENQRAEVVLSEKMHSLCCADGKPGKGYPAIMNKAAVRRLTPIECERLMGFPDGWTENTTYPDYIKNIGGHLSDSTRYRMLGNSVAVPVVEWIFRRMVI